MSEAKKLRAVPIPINRSCDEAMEAAIDRLPTARALVVIVLDNDGTIRSEWSNGTVGEQMQLGLFAFHRLIDSFQEQP